MILEFDLGNSRFKWRLVDDAGGQPAVLPADDATARAVTHRIISSGITSADDRSIAALLSDLRTPPERVRGGSVAAQALDAALGGMVKRQWDVEVEFAQSSPACAGVRNGYADPTRLGVDRWLALVAAYRLRRRAALVIDAGSALTIDLVDADGEHLGGYIVPGRQMLLDNLPVATARVRFDRLQAPNAGPGRDTASAVAGGVELVLCGLLQAAIDEAGSRLADYDLVLTGGDGPRLQPECVLRGPAHVVLMPDLVLDGLRWVVP